MEITWYGLSCFRLTEKKMATVVMDPYDSNVIGYEPLKLKADIVTISHDAAGHNHTSAVKGTTHVINGAGEFEIGGVFITGVQTDATGKKAADLPRNNLFVFDFNGITVAHLGDLHSVPTQSEVEALGNVNIVLVPVGGGNGLNAAKAAEVVSLLEPNIVIPMHYSTPGVKLELERVDKFLKEMGLHEARKEDSLTVKKSDLPDETQVVLLAYQHQGS
jgi:L-ascorbate metabolism protein UlaG (beta-lactamase superfamily)